ncbi:MAG: DUF4384 domain-containing protein [Chloracidobacterium sp.]|nr:DUF4384 domain-containing protein [Chloracidobacterium sp.]MDW8217868.1 DUF4384 domain-containing protein [Acidobacteriota bacterium]
MSGAGGKVVKTGQAASPQLLGLTLWRLRELRAGESAADAVKVQNADQSGWHWRVPERSSFARPVVPNDIVRLTVEAAREGYLYILNRELRRDRSLGKPVLLFPERAAVNNFVRPGEVVDVPDRLEDWPYFRIVSSDPNYAGEALWVILSPRRIDGLTDGRRRPITSLGIGS